MISMHISGDSSRADLDFNEGDRAGQEVCIGTQFSVPRSAGCSIDGGALTQSLCGRVGFQEWGQDLIDEPEQTDVHLWLGFRIMGS